MNLEHVEKIASAVLYEGYILYPYRPSSVKNRRRFNFGVLAPPAYGLEPSEMRTECLSTSPNISVKVRFLQVIGGDGTWQSAVEREICLPGCGLESVVREAVMGPLVAHVEVSVRDLGESLYRVSVRIANQTPIDWEPQIRDEILPLSLASAHTILSVEDGEFVSLLDPPEALREAANQCQNVGAWPVLAGEEGTRNVMLSSPIILYDYPQVAAESPGDLFDGTEIDEILTLRIMTLTDDEKREMREADEMGRRILERTEALPAEHMMKLHGVLRGMRPDGGIR